MRLARVAGAETGPRSRRIQVQISRDIAGQVLRKLLVDRLDLTPFHEAEKWGYHFCGPGLTGVCCRARALPLAMVAPYLKALRCQALSCSAFPSHSSLMLTRRGSHFVSGHGPPPGAADSPTASAPEHSQSSPIPHRPVSSEPYLRRLSGMMVVSGDVAINGRASGSSWSLRAYPPWTKTA
jgi:hypothetical protein